MCYTPYTTHIYHTTEGMLSLAYVIHIKMFMFNYLPILVPSQFLFVVRKHWVNLVLLEETLLLLELNLEGY